MGTLLTYLCSMLTKYYIEIDGVKAEVPKGCLKNWDEIKCVYKRSDFSGVTRSFTTQFEFVGEMYDRLMALYLRDGVNARAAISLYTITNEWAWEEQFTCDLDFSSIEWDNYVVKMNSIDDSLASAIKARKSTKYEFVVGQDIPVADTLKFDRIKMQNSCAHEIQGDEAANNSKQVKLYPASLKRLPTYLVGDAETYENSPVLFQDQDDESGSCFLEIVNNANDIEINIEIRVACPESFDGIIDNAKIYLMSYQKANKDYNANTYTNLGELLSYTSNSESQRTYLGLFPTFEALKRKYATPPANSWALVGEEWATAKEAYISSQGNISPREWIFANPWSGHEYRGGPVTSRGCSLFVYRNKFTLKNVASGTCYALFYELSMHSKHSSFRQQSMSLISDIQTRWESRAKTISIDALQPTNVLNALMDKIVENGLNVSADISNADARIPKTYLLAAESVRNIPGAKLYTSFNDFCDWMETVFGYTYYLGDRTKAQFKRTQEYSLQFPLGTAHLLHTQCPGGYGNQVIIVEGTPYFAVLGDDYNSDGTLNFYTKWPGSDAYNDPETGKARLDTLFYDADYNQGVYFDEEYTLKSYSGDVSRGVRDTQTIHFVPRTEIFAGAHTIKLANVRDLEFSINTGLAYSALTIGYEKQEYEAECGRDEWNFSAQYTTGVDKFDKRLSLVSKYRADCYGLEFLSQERAKDTTDNKSDNTVFFVLCQSEEEEQEDTSAGSRGDEEGDTTTIITRSLVCDRTAVISGALSDTVFNGAFAPYLCAKANGAYIAASKCPMALKFASFDGNTDVSIDGIKGNADLQLNEQLFTLGEIQFSSPDVDADLDVNALYEVHSHGITYRGFLKEVQFKYAKAEIVKYKLIVKEIEL